MQSRLVAQLGLTEVTLLPSQHLLYGHNTVSILFFCHCEDRYACSIVCSRVHVAYNPAISFRLAYSPSHTSSDRFSNVGRQGAHRRDWPEAPKSRNELCDGDGAPHLTCTLLLEDQGST